MSESGLATRHRDKNGEISVLHRFNEQSLNQLHGDHDGRQRDAKIRSHS